MLGLNDDQKKVVSILIGLWTLCGIGFGYSLGRRKDYIIKNHAFLFAIPSGYTKEEAQYYLDKAMEKLKFYNYEVSDEKLLEINKQCLEEVNSSRQLVDGLFQLGEEE